ncbi:MAG: ABC transporter permease [Actinomycetota bacterium]|nr:ABC transporter permease [Actinomycetota bacterium]
MTAVDRFRRPRTFAWRPARAEAGLWQRLWGHGGGRFGVVLLAAIGIVAVLGPVLVSADPNEPDYTNELAEPGGAHLLGTDGAGRDLLARTLVGARTSLGAALIVMAIVTVIGLVVGVLSGSAGGVVDGVLNRLTDAVLGLPSLVITLAIVGVLGPTFANLVLAMSATGWASLAKLARSHTLGAGRRPDVIAARMAGAGPLRVALGHVLPGAVSLVLVASTLRLGTTVVSLAGLSFLGLGAQPPTAEWGKMLSDSRETLAYAPFQIIGPCAGLMLTVLAATLVSDALRDVSEPGARA